MPRSNADRDTPAGFILPRDRLGRLATFLASAFFAPLSGVVFYGMVFRLPPAKAPLEFIAKILVEEAALFGFIFFSLALVWALAMPRWLERWVQWSVGRFMLAVALFSVLSLPIVFWALAHA
jgi:hypothetical protein